MLAQYLKTWLGQYDGSVDKSTWHQPKCNQWDLHGRRETTSDCPLSLRGMDVDRHGNGLGQVQTNRANKCN